MKRQTKAYFYALVTVGLWSTVASMSKITLRYLTPTQFLFCASLVSLAVLFSIIVFQKKITILRKSSRREVLQGAAFGFLNPFAYYLLLFRAYDMLPAQQAQIINYTWALTLTLLSIPLLKQRVSKQQWLAIVISYFGVVVIATKGRLLGFQIDNPQGVACALLSTVVWALYWIFNTRDKRDPLVGLFLNFLWGCPMVLVYLICTEGFQAMSLPGVLGAAYIGIFEMGVAFVLWLTAMKLTDSTAKIANLIFLSPIISLFLIYYIVGEEIYISTVAGLILVLCGLGVQAVSEKKVHEDTLM
jgi:drug/metabolite transporter (DMT)-like permease